MSRARYRHGRFRAPSLAAAGLLAATLIWTAARALADDTLDRARRLNEITAQKIETEVRAALRETMRMTDREKAAARLKKALAAVEDDTSLSESRRKTLIRMLKDRIRVTEIVDKFDDRSGKRLEAAVRKVGQERQAEEQRKIKTTLDVIRDLRKEGKTDEANRLARQLAREYPDNPAVQASVRSTATADQLADKRRLREDSDRRATSVLRDNDRSSLPPTSDYEGPKGAALQRFKERKPATVRLTTKEKAILEALKSPITVRFRDSPFQDVIQYLSTVTDQTILLDRAALKDAGIDYDSPVTLNVKGVSLRTVLRKILGEFGLTYVVKDEVIQVVSTQKAKEMMVVRAYPIGDLLNMPGLLPGSGLRFGPGIRQLEAVQNAAAIIDLVQSTVEPDSWKANGGSGTITFHAPTMSLVIKNSAEVHAMLGGGLLK